MLKVAHQSTPESRFHYNNTNKFKKINFAAQTIKSELFFLSFPERISKLITEVINNAQFTDTTWIFNLSNIN